MLDMGFFDDIMRIVRELPVERQTLMFSATMPPKIRKLAQGILHNPVNVNIAIMRSFIKLREVLTAHKDLVRKLEELENKYDKQFQIVFDAIRQILVPLKSQSGKSVSV